MMYRYLNTGLKYCYDVKGRVVDCLGSGQDAEFAPGRPWPEPRFETAPETVLDRLTGLVWLKDANPALAPLTWTEALEYVRSLNRRKVGGRQDWRLPNRRELRSLIDYQNRKPALPSGHPFEGVFLGWYWTGTSAAINPAFAWYVHLEGGRMFYGKKDQSFLVWPVGGEGDALPQTGQIECFDDQGRLVPPQGTGQDGEFRFGIPWPRPRFAVRALRVKDLLTGLVWTRTASLVSEPADWSRALDAIRALNRGKYAGLDTWRLPTINELESLVDASLHSPALPSDHPFDRTLTTYCSSTSSGFEPDWCMVLHLHKGAVGVGQKKSRGYGVWAVSSAEAGW